MRTYARMLTMLLLCDVNKPVAIIMSLQQVYARKCDYIAVVHAHSLAAPCLAFGGHISETVQGRR